MDDFDYVPGFVPSPFVTTAAPDISEYEFPDIQKEAQKRSTQTHRVTVQKTQTSVLEKVAVFIACAIVALAMSFTIISLNEVIVTNNNTIAELQSEIDQAQAENVRLNAAICSMASVDKIQEYAVSVLGMQKAERYQIHYFEDRDGDKVVIADGKALNADKQDI